MKNYDQLLYNILKPLVVLNGHRRNNAVDIYLNDVPVDENSQPKDFILYRTNISNVPQMYGDGRVLTRKCACDVLVNEQDNGNNANAGYLINRVEQILIDNNINYTKVSIGYNKDTDSMQTTFDFFL